MAYIPSTHQLRELDEVVAAISNIAHQTNRLALDAAVQAAIAGENDKGFGAVAADMRSLAERANKEAKTLARIARSIREDIAAIEEVDEQDIKKQNQVSSQGDNMKQLRLTIELIPDPLQGVSLYNILRKSGKSSAWNKLREQVIAQQNARCGICQVENVTLICHEIWRYDDMSHIRALTGLIAICKMCDHCKHMGFTKILAAQGKLDLNSVIEYFKRVNQCSHEQYIEHLNQASKIQRERNKHQWTTDFGAYAHLLPQDNSQQ